MHLYYANVPIMRLLVTSKVILNRFGSELLFGSSAKEIKLEISPNNTYSKMYSKGNAIGDIKVLVLTLPRKTKSELPSVT